MGRFTKLVAITLVAGLAVSACAGADLARNPPTNPPPAPQPGSDEARIQECMETASRSVCEMKIVGP